MSVVVSSGRSRSIATLVVRVVLAAALSFGLLVGTARTASAADDYPHKNAVDCSAQYGKYSWCINNVWYSSRLFAYRNCTDWVGWRLATTNGVSGFNNNYGGRRWGNANTWDDTARALGIPVNGTPARGAIAQTDAGSYGHVAWVSAVNGNGTVTIEEYNYGGNGTYSTRTVSTGSFVYIHVKDLTNDNPFGAYDTLTSPGPGLARADGWAIDPNSRTTSLSVHVYVDGRFQGAYDANLSRPDVANAYPGSGDRHGFADTFNIAAGTHTVCVYAINIGAGTENPQLGCKTVSVVNGDPFGAFDEVTSPEPGKIRVRGWAVDPSDRPTPINVHIYVGGRAGSGAPGYDIGKATASRPDVAAAIPGAGPNHGFDKTLPAAAGSYIVCAYAINIGGGVTNTELLCRNVTVLPALTAPTPTIAGTAKVGYALTGRTGSWGPGPVELAYQWNRNGKAIAGATQPSHTLTAEDRGARLTLSVTGSRSGYAAVTKTSAATAEVAYGTLTAPTPKITGSAKVGKTLTTVPGAWGPKPVALKYQWKADGKSISGATKSTFKVTSKQKAKKITVTVTGSKNGYSTASKTSAATGKVR